MNAAEGGRDWGRIAVLVRGRGILVAAQVPLHQAKLTPRWRDIGWRFVRFGTIFLVFYFGFGHTPPIWLAHPVDYVDVMG